MTAESKATIAARKRWANPEFREKYLEVMRRRWARDEERKRHSAWMSARWADPEEAARQKEAIRDGITKYYAGKKTSK